jgi:tRNA (guanosine-2'-O-)-methyltransferase
MTSNQIIDYFQTFLSEHKKSLFDKIIHDRTRHVTVVLEDLFHPHNTSAILRNCDCFGIQDIHVIENNHQFVNSRDISKGSNKWLDMYRYDENEQNTLTCLETLKKDGYLIAAMSPNENDILIDDLPVDQKIAMVFGAEKFGLSEKTKQAADVFVKIPMLGFTESFNVSVSAALSLSLLAQKIRSQNVKWQLTPEEIQRIKLTWTLRTIQSARSIVKRFLSENPEAIGLYDFKEFLE